MPFDSEHTEAMEFTAKFDLCLQLSQEPRSPDVAIYVSMTMTPTQLITLPLARACGVIIGIQYSLDQMPFSNRSHTSRCSEGNSGHSQLEAAATMRVTCIHIDKPRDSIAMHSIIVVL